ncbi:aldehyde dehydrogenase [Neolentinus lepideus HHB14362 ss-1]|uniref:Aldehyde dehydrogenase n=1 Tax=Neolentinus lepideus HHB14362 ss-1 TaxID=1314782 RepID=A0A165SYC8_9AGAM|nr:aldehyde dehydrogenase [Neolentinus lepideus HHB14362 ss-1]
MTMLKYTPVSEVEPTYKQLSNTFHSGATLPLAYRRKQLLQLARMIQDNIEAWEAAIFSDLAKPKQEVAMAELGPVVSSALLAADKLEEWNEPVRPEVEAWRSSWDTTIYTVPKGVCLIISPWNYPYIISLCPLVGAIAAGCAVILKPSELAPATAQIFADLIPKYLDPNAYAVVNGAVAETSALLNLKWNHIMYTGGIRVGRIIAAAAAKNVTPVTLELGGKSPVFVDVDNTDIEIAAKRILFGKQQNSGQLCVSPDYALVPRHKKAEFIAALEKAYKAFYPDGPLAPTSHIGKIINPSHHARLSWMLKNTKGKIVIGGQIEGDKRIAPTVVDDVPLDDVLMEDELFGPILPIVPVDDVEHALRIIRERSYPLVLYCFTENEDVRQKFVTRTNSGTVTFNDTYSQLAVHEIPFGGQGDSGYGTWNGKYSFDIFAHKRGSTNVPIAADPDMGLRYPPYSDESYNVFAGAVRQPIPEA